jgi:sn-1 stearoyl-lipid 9-desaturase
LTTKFNPNLSFVCEPTFGFTRDGRRPYKPALREIAVELLDALDFVQRPRRLMIAGLFAMHVFTMVCAAVWLVRYLDVPSLLFVFATTVVMAHGFVTFWYHRYCSHRAFTFARPGCARVLLWLNPLYFPEERYAISHWQHHTRADEVGDPYGPHLGWLGCYFGLESAQKLAVDIPAARYLKLTRHLQHIGFPINDYATFRRSGMVETLRHYLLRTVFAQTLWCTSVYALGGMRYLLAWYASAFLLWSLQRDFAYRAHRGQRVPGWEFDQRSAALNRRFYGYSSSEWHDNHHSFPSSANTAFLPGQFDLVFQIIRFMRWLGLISFYIDARARFEARLTPKPAPAA